MDVVRETALELAYITGLPLPKNVLKDLRARRAIAEQAKNQAAVLLGRMGGLKGGKARAAALSPKERNEIATKAAIARWEMVRAIKAGGSSKTLAKEFGVTWQKIEEMKRRLQEQLPK